MDEFRFGWRGIGTVWWHRRIHFMASISHLFRSFSASLVLLLSLLSIFYANVEIWDNIPLFQDLFMHMSLCLLSLPYKGHFRIISNRRNWTHAKNRRLKNDLWIIDYTLFSRAHSKQKVRAKFHFLQNDGISLCFKDTMCWHSLDANDKLLRTTFAHKKAFYFLAKVSRMENSSGFVVVVPCRAVWPGLAVVVADIVVIISFQQNTSESQSFSRLSSQFSFTPDEAFT